MQAPQMNLNLAIKEFDVHASFFHKKNIERQKAGKMAKEDVSRQFEVRRGILNDLHCLIKKGVASDNDDRQAGLKLIKSDMEAIVKSGPLLVQRRKVTHANLQRRIACLQFIIKTIQDIVYTGSHRPISGAVQTDLFNQSNAA